jgi:hypothetical protein
MPALSFSPKSYGCTRSAGSSFIPVRGARIVAPKRLWRSNAERVWWRFVSRISPISLPSNQSRPSGGAIGSMRMPSSTR